MVLSNLALLTVGLGEMWEVEMWEVVDDTQVVLT